MANKKRDKNGYRSQLGRYRLNRKNILTIEKMLRVYADAKEMKSSKVESTIKARKHVPRKYTDSNIKIGRYRPFSIHLNRNHFQINYSGVDYIFDADSVKFLPKEITKSRYVRVECHPGISIIFRPFSTEIYAQTQYATGLELRVMKKVIHDIESYLTGLSVSTLNMVSLAK